MSDYFDVLSQLPTDKLLDLLEQRYRPSLVSPSQGTESASTVNVQREGQAVLELIARVRRMAQPLPALPDTPTKQMLVLRKDLNMRKGKMVAQGAHASMGVFLQDAVFEQQPDGIWCRFRVTSEAAAWLQGSFRKICVSVPNETELLSVFEHAKALGLPAYLIQDSGKTEFHGVPTYTAVAIGPAAEPLVDKVTADLSPL